MMHSLKSSAYNIGIIPYHWTMAGAHMSTHGSPEFRKQPSRKRMHALIKDATAPVHWKLTLIKVELQLRRTLIKDGSSTLEAPIKDTNTNKGRLFSSSTAKGPHMPGYLSGVNHATAISTLNA
jgi:hypothetical protein